jgi:hypothetical protein
LRAHAAQKGAVKIAERAAAVREQDRVLAVGVLDAGQLVGHIVQGLVPRHTLPFAFASFARAHHGVLRAVLVKGQGRAGGAAGAQGTHDAGGIGISLDVLRFAVDHFDLDGTAYRAHAAYALYKFLTHTLLLYRQ